MYKIIIILLLISSLAFAESRIDAKFKLHSTIIAKEKGIGFAQKVLGHKDITVTQRYVHYDREYLQENMNKIKALDKIFK